MATDSGWNIRSLKEHIERLLDERDKRYDERRENQKREVETALVSINERLAQLNELRGQSADRDKNMISRVEYDTAHGALVTQVNDLKSRIDRSEGRGTGLNAGWIYILGLIAALGTLVSIWLAMR